MMQTTESSLLELLERCHELVMGAELPEDDAAETIGYFPVYIPEEIV